MQSTVWHNDTIYRVIMMQSTVWHNGDTVRVQWGYIEGIVGVQ